MTKRFFLGKIMKNKQRGPTWVKGKEMNRNMVLAEIHLPKEGWAIKYRPSQEGLTAYVEFKKT